jgi:hypothetical protein
MVEEAYLCYFGKGDSIGLAKINAQMSEKEIEEFIRKNIRSLDMVYSTTTLIVQEGKQLIDEEIEDEEDDWERRSKKDFFVPDED